jgi:hypothetical protein
MSSATLDRPTESTLRKEIDSLRKRVEYLESRMAEDSVAPAEDWRVALKRAQEGWASMDPEFQAECLATFEDVRRQIRESDGDA